MDYYKKQRIEKERRYLERVAFLRWDTSIGEQTETGWDWQGHERAKQLYLRLEKEYGR